MKKILILCITCSLCFCLSACGGMDMTYVKTRKVESELYSSREIASAINTIKREFQKNWDGCVLTEIYYAGDAVSEAHQDWADRNDADEVIVLKSSFYVGFSGGDGSLNPNSVYERWNWILVRTNNGAWVHVDHGY